MLSACGCVSLPSLPLLSHGLLWCVFTMSLLFAPLSPCPPPLKTERREKDTCRLKISMNRRRRESRWRGGGWIPRSRAPGECLAAALSPDSGHRSRGRLPHPLPKENSVHHHGIQSLRTIRQECHQFRPLNPFRFSGGHRMTGGQRCHLRPQSATKFHIAQTHN